MKKASKLVKNKGKETVLRDNHNLFELIILVAQNRKMQMNEVLKHSLGKLPYSLATSDGLPRKTAKTLGKQVIKPVPFAESRQIPAESLIIVMTIVQRIARDKKTLVEIASAVFARGIAELGTSRWADFVFDVYVPGELNQGL